MPQRVRINRSERRPPFLSNIVNGSAEQVAPNALTHDGERPQVDTFDALRTGAGPAFTPILPADWKGNRSGE